jgi:benzoyl-CoA reductase/2-hydroxyglutaryl-CoA dehydratase subunit BcrC/BadD/HgdB
MSTTSAASADRRNAVEELTTLPLRGENPYVREWKEKGGRVFGYTCSYVPEEILYAEGQPSRILPVRLGAQGCATTDDADIYMHKFLCSYCRCLVQLALEGEYNFLDGVVLTSGCEHMRRTFEIWRDQVRPAFVSMLSVPHCRESENHLRWFREEVETLADEIGKRYGTLPSKESLRSAIRTYNHYRRLMLELYDLRSADRPKLTGAEAMKIAQASYRMPKEIFNERLAAAIEELKQRPGVADARARILVAGSYMDDPWLFEIIESTGALVVTDTLCTGRKHIEGMVEETADPMEAIVRRYFLRDPSCPRMVDGYPGRIAFTRRLAQQARVDGVIFERITFCDSHTVENVMESRDLEDLGVPTLSLEREYLGGDRGRLKTRVQAFLEKIGR